MADYSPQIALAKRLIRTKGRTVALQRLSEQPEDPARPWRGPLEASLVAQATTISVVAVPPSSASSLGLSWTTDDTMKALEQILICEVGEDFPEELGEFHRVEEADGSHWRVMKTEQLRPATQTVLYFIGVRR